MILPLAVGVSACLLIASDMRLLRAAEAEGLAALNPEQVSASDVPVRLTALSLFALLCRKLPMKLYLPAALVLMTALFATATQAQTPRYHFTAGETLRYLIQRDPYFADPKAAIETVGTDAPYRAPVVERLMEKVQAVAADGTATLLLTLTPEPGFEDEEAPQPAVTRTAVVTPAGKVLSVSGTALGTSPAERDLLRGIALTPPASAVRPGGLAVVTQAHPIPLAQSQSSGHDGTLLQTTRAAQSDHLVFDSRRGRLDREISTMTIMMSLVMTGRGRRGSDDFGHVVPNVHVVQTLTIERQTD